MRLRALLLFCSLTLLCGCAKRDASPLSAGTVVQRSQLASVLPGFMGDGPYAAVKFDALTEFYDSYHKKLFDEGVTKWDARFDCNHFASYYIAYAQTQYYLTNFHASTPAQTLALAEVWYRPGAGLSGHAIVAALTDRGLIFIEPQTGSVIQLTQRERETILLVKW